MEEGKKVLRTHLQSYCCHFDSTNEIISPLRAALNINTVTALSFINCVGLPLAEFRPEKFTRLWLVKDRRSDDGRYSTRENKIINNTRH